VDAPGIPADEFERLRALWRYEVLDTVEEVDFDSLAKLAAHILEVPTALISLVDTDRQWFKARYGLEARELPRDISFCGHVVDGGEPLVVPDAHLDPRFADNPLVTGDPNIRFYAGMPLRTPDGYVLGSLCAIDHVPRTPTASQLEMLAILSRQVIVLLEKRRAGLAVAADRDAAVAAASRMTAMFEVMAEGVVVQDGSGAIIATNVAASSILGLTDDQLHGRTSLDPRWCAVHEDGSPFPGAQHPSMEAIRTGERQLNVIMGVQKPDATVTWISINAQPVRIVEGAVQEVVTTFHDITPLREAADRIAQQQRLVTTGTLAAGVGHEINNPLTFMLGNLDLALEELHALAGVVPASALGELQEMVGDARLGAERIRRIVRGLRALSREDVQLQSVDLASVVDLSLGMAQHELRSRATVTSDLVDLPPVLGDESRLTQVLVNLLVNAGQAFERADPTANRVAIRGAVTGAMVRLSVSDNGPGIAAEIVSRIFDPFFTTKPVGEGTGLGLAVSRGLISALGGQMTLESAPGMGATFHIDLPVAPPSSTAADAALDTAGPRGRVVVIDDDVSVLATMRRVLSREHDVTAFGDSREALAFLAEATGFDVILCDLMMPHLNGQELFFEIRERRPELAPLFVFVTGGATISALRVFLAQLPNDIVEKPFNLGDLLAVARRYVQRRGGR
jgi:PAS domain S-box-containing protein